VYKVGKSILVGLLLLVGTLKSNYDWSSALDWQR